MVHLLLQPHLGGAEAGRIAPGPVGQDRNVVYLCLHVVEQRGLDVLQGAGLAVSMLQVLHPLSQAVVPAGRLLVLRAGRKVGCGGCLGTGAEPAAWSQDPLGIGRQGSQRAEERSLLAPTATEDRKDGARILTLTLHPRTAPQLTVGPTGRSIFPGCGAGRACTGKPRAARAGQASRMPLQTPFSRQPVVTWMWPLCI